MKKIIIIIIVILVCIIGITAYLNMGSIKASKENQDNAYISINVDGKEAAKLDMNKVKALGTVDFDANLKTNGKPAQKHSFTGVPLKKVLESLNINLDGKSSITVKAVDGYNSALTVDEVKENDNVYLAFMIDKKPLGKKEDGGSGPYEVIIRKDSFSQRWCKFAVEVDIK